MKHIRLQTSALLLVLLGLSCATPNEADVPLHAPGASTPVVSGLRVIDFNALSVVIWGTPSDFAPTTGVSGGGGEPGPVPFQYGAPYVFPDPFDSVCTIQFPLPVESHVSLWVVRARWVGDPGNDLTVMGNSTLLAPQTLAVAVLLRNEKLLSGVYRYQWFGTDDDNHVLPAGFYRIYFKAESFLVWRDTFLYHSLDDLPAGLRSLIAH